jgi:hypothetical protein
VRDARAANQSALIGFDRDSWRYSSLDYPKDLGFALCKGRGDFGGTPSGSDQRLESSGRRTGPALPSLGYNSTHLLSTIFSIGQHRKTFKGKDEEWQPVGHGWSHVLASFTSYRANLTKGFAFSLENQFPD